MGDGKKVKKLVDTLGFGPPLTAMLKVVRADKVSPPNHPELAECRIVLEGDSSDFVRVEIWLRGDPENVQLKRLEFIKHAGFVLRGVE